MSSNPFASWPDQGLDWRLIEGYFDYVNVLLPLLHRPTFYRFIQSPPSFSPSFPELTRSTIFFLPADNTLLSYTTRTLGSHERACLFLQLDPIIAMIPGCTFPERTEGKTMVWIRRAGYIVCALLA